MAFELVLSVEYANGMLCKMEEKLTVSVSDDPRAAGAELHLPSI